MIVVKSGKYGLKARTLPDGTKIPARDVYHFDYDVVDWLHIDGKTLLSKRGDAAAASESQVEEPPSWDDTDSLSDEEKELLRA